MKQSYHIFLSWTIDDSHTGEMLYVPETKNSF